MSATTNLNNLWMQQHMFTSFVMATLDTPLKDQSKEDKIRLTKEYIEYLHAELVEVLNNIPWKKHRYTGETDRHNLVEELIDVQKFLWGLMDIWDVSLEEFEEVFNNKTEVVWQRFRQEHVYAKELEDAKIAVVDIDDVIADWFEGFNYYVSWKHQNVEKNEYEKNTALREILKKEARHYGIMPVLAVKKGASTGIYKLLAANYKIVFLTARPIKECPRLITDTIVWLKANGFPNKYVYFSDVNKHMFIMDNFPNAKVIFDDDDMIIAKAKMGGYNAIKVTTTLDAAVEEFLSDPTNSNNRRD